MVQRFLVRLLLVLGSSLLVLGVGELALTAWYGELGAWGPYELVEAWDSPYVIRAKPALGDHPAVLARTRPAPDGVRRILSYGDSIAAGYGVAAKEAYVHRLEQLLSQESGVPTEVLRMNRGHSPTLYGFHVRVDLPRLQPDGVLVQIELVNDTSDEAHVTTSGRDVDGLPLELHTYRYILGWDGHLLAPLTLSGSWIERTKLYAKASRFVGRLRNRMAPNPIFAADSGVATYSFSSDRYFLTRETLDRGFERTFDAVASIQRYVERHGVAFLLVIMPSSHVYDGGRYSEYAAALLARAEATAAERSIPFFSLREAFESGGGDALFMDFCHPTAAGHAVVAEALAERWAQRPGERPGSRRGGR